MLTHLNNKEIPPERVVVLGAAGFIGKRLVKALQDKNIEVLPVTRNDIDLTKPEAVDKLAGLLKAKDSVVFLAVIPPNKGKGTDALIDNLSIGHNVVQALTKRPVSHVVYLSSDAVYSFRNHIISESSATDPSDLYGIMHKSRELMLGNFRSDLAVIRSTAVYGAGDTHNSYGPNRFLKHIVEKGEITLFGKGEDVRNHLYIDDLVFLITGGLFRKSIGILNACSLYSKSFYEIASLIIKKLGYGKIVEVNQAQDTLYRYFDTGVILRAFPDLVLTTLDEGLDKVISELGIISKCK